MFQSLKAAVAGEGRDTLAGVLEASSTIFAPCRVFCAFSKLSSCWSLSSWPGLLVTTATDSSLRLQRTLTWPELEAPLVFSSSFYFSLLFISLPTLPQTWLRYLMVLVGFISVCRC